jgi:hypothetical protein
MARIDSNVRCSRHRLAGWRATQIHQAILISFHLYANHYELQQLRYDLRKMKAHDLVQRDGHHYTRLTDKRVKIALLFVFLQLYMYICVLHAHSGSCTTKRNKRF